MQRGRVECSSSFVLSGVLPGSSRLSFMSSVIDAGSDKLLIKLTSIGSNSAVVVDLCAHSVGGVLSKQQRPAWESSFPIACDSSKATTYDYL